MDNLENYKALLDSAKTMFNSERELNQEELDTFNYLKTVSTLQQVIDLNPTNAEARYYLGYTYQQNQFKRRKGV